MSECFISPALDSSPFGAAGDRFSFLVPVLAVRFWSFCSGRSFLFGVVVGVFVSGRFGGLFGSRPWPFGSGRCCFRLRAFPFLVCVFLGGLVVLSKSDVVFIVTSD